MTATAHPRRHVSLARLARGSHGPEVAKVQRLLNARIHPCPSLKVDAVFGNQTLAAVRVFQRSRHIDADGVVGPKTWGYLLAGVISAGPRAPVKGLEGAFSAAPVAPTRSSSVPVTVWEWPLPKKLEAVIERVPRRLSSEAAREFKSMMQPQALAVALALVALFAMLSGGTALVVGLVALGADVGMSLATALLIASTASSTADLDEAADALAHVVLTVGVSAFLAGIARIANQAANALRVKGRTPLDPAPPPSEEVVAPVEPTPIAPKGVSLPPNPTLARLRALPRAELLREIRRATGDREIVLWEQVEYGSIPQAVRAGPETAQALGVPRGQIIGYKVPEGVGHQKGGAIGDLMNATPQPASPYGDPFL
jgi:hypothetical protein